MLLRGANGVGYTNYPDNVVRFFVSEAARAGIDLFRVFDCLNWAENMRVAMDAVLEVGKTLRGGDLLHRRRPRPARGRNTTSPITSGSRSELEKAGAHIIAVKDMAGVMKPAAATRSLHRAPRRGRQRRSTSTRTTRPGSLRRRCSPRSKRASMPSTRRWIRSPASPRSPASARSSRRSTRPTVRPASTSMRSAGSRSTGRPCASSTPPSRATSAPARRRCTCTRCRAGSSPT